MYFSHVLVVSVHLSSSLYLIILLFLILKINSHLLSLHSINCSSDRIANSNLVYIFVFLCILYILYNSDVLLYRIAYLSFTSVISIFLSKVIFFHLLFKRNSHCFISFIIIYSLSSKYSLDISL